MENLQKKFIPFLFAFPKIFHIDRILVKTVYFIEFRCR